jgi:hypothetical protein
MQFKYFTMALNFLTLGPSTSSVIGGCCRYDMARCYRGRENNTKATMASLAALFEFLLLSLAAQNCEPASCVRHQATRRKSKSVNSECLSNIICILSAVQFGYEAVN